MIEGNKRSGNKEVLHLSEINFHIHTRERESEEKGRDIKREEQNKRDREREREDPIRCHSSTDLRPLWFLSKPRVFSPPLPFAPCDPFSLLP